VCLQQNDYQNSSLSGGSLFKPKNMNNKQILDAKQALKKIFGTDSVPVEGIQEIEGKTCKTVQLHISNEINSSELNELDYEMNMYGQENRKYKLKRAGSGIRIVIY
jgi:hypothetical protein